MSDEYSSLGPSRTYLWHSELISVILGELDIVFLLWLHVAEPAQVDDETLVHSGRDLTIAKRIAMNLGVPGVLLRHGEIALGIGVVEWEGKGVIGVLGSVSPDDLAPSGIVLDAVYKVSVENNLTECHGLLSHVMALVVTLMSVGTAFFACHDAELTRAGRVSPSAKFPSLVGGLDRIPGVRTAPAQMTYFLALM